MSIRRASGQLGLPKSMPLPINHIMVAGTLVSDPRPGRSPAGGSATFLQIEFPVADPENPHLLWTWAGCDVEVSEALAQKHGILELQGGATILAAGQLGDRWAINDGRTGKRAVIVAVLIHPGLPPEDDRVAVPARQPES